MDINSFAEIPVRVTRKLDDIIAELKLEHEMIQRAIESIENLNNALEQRKEPWPEALERCRSPRARAACVVS